MRNFLLIWNIKYNYKIITLSILLAYLMVHVVCLIIYTNPFVFFKSKLDFYSQALIYPYFHQNWSLFAPVPDANYELYCKYDEKGKQKFCNVFSEVTLLHQTNRLLGYESIVLAFANSIHYFEKNTKELQLVNGPINRDINFKILERITKSYLQYSRKIIIKHFKLILIIKQIKTHQQKIYYN